MRTLRIALADDHPIVLAGMKDFLQQQPCLEVTGTFTTSSALIEHLRVREVDVVITDYTMPNDAVHGDGLRYVDYLVRTFRELRLLVLTMVSNPMIVSALYDVGVSGVILKGDPMREVLSALQAVRANTRYYPASFQSDGGRAQRSIFLQERLKSLSPRELEVLRHFTQGASIAQIADRLKRSAKTVSLQKNSAMRKLNASNNQELIKFCTQNRLFD